MTTDVKTQVTYRSLLNGCEDTCGLHNILSTCITPLDVGWVPPAWTDGNHEVLIHYTHTFCKYSTQHSLAKDCDDVTINDQLATFSLNFTLVLSMGGVILEHVDLFKEE